MEKNSVNNGIDQSRQKWFNSKHIRSSTKMLLIAILIGVLGGVGAVLFHETLNWTKEILLLQYGGLRIPSGEIVSGLIPSWLFFVIPMLGGLISGMLVYSLAPEAEGHGTDAMIDSFHNKGGRVRARVPLVKAAASIITIGSGGSAGYEGPTAQIGSGLGAILARLFKVPQKMARLLLLAGTSAGLGAIFRAPLGGALTSVEVIYKEDFESEGFLPCIVASVVAYATFMLMSPETKPLFHIPDISYGNQMELVFYGLLGILCAPVSKIFVKFFYFISELFQRLTIPRHFKPAIGGLVVGLIAYTCPQAIGGGWEYLNEAINGHIAAHFLLMIAGYKIVTTAFTVASGGSGGVFGPSLFIGGMLGGAYGYGLERLFPNLIEYPAAYVLVGMGAFFAGAANAPIASIIMVCEITGNYHLLAPLMLASVLHIMLSRKWSIYKNQKMNKFDSPVHREALNSDILRSLTVASALQQREQITFVRIHDNLKDIRWLLKDTEAEVFPVLGENGGIVGLLGLNNLRKVILDTSAEHLVIVEDMMTDVHLLKEDMDLHMASQIFLSSELPELPVMDGKGKVLGMIKYQDIVLAYDEAVKG